MSDSGFKRIEENRGKPGTGVEKDGIYFGCYASGTEAPSLILYRRGTKEVAAEVPFPSECTPDGIYSMKLKLPAAQYEYNFRIDGEIVTDPFARRVCGRETFGEIPDEDEGSLRGGFPVRKFKWEDDRLPEIPHEEAVMYHLHVRGFTMQKNSGVRKKGTFAGLREKIPYLKSLGINQVRLMPVYEFAEMVSLAPEKRGMAKSQQEAIRRSLEYMEDEKKYRMNFWGYGDGFYFAPKASYAYSDDPVTEMKEMVRAFHANGIEVLLEFYFSDRTDVGTIAHCLNFWAREYHIDGFSVIARDTLSPELARLPLFQKRKLICSWFPDEIRMENAVEGEFQIAASNDGFMNDCRRMLKGDADALAAFAYRLRANPAGCQNINYMTNHDGFTMLDLVSYDRKHNAENGEKERDGTDYNLSWNCGAEGETKKKEILRLRMRQRKNAYAMLLFSQGIPMLLAGDEIGNSQGGNNNPYCHDSELTWTDWSKSRSSRELTDFVKKAVAYRKAHKVLHQASELKCTDYLSSGFPDLSYHGDRAWYGDFDGPNRHLGSMYSGAYAGEKGYVYIAWNLHWGEQEFALPLLGKKERWYKVMDTSQRESFTEEVLELSDQDKSILVPGRTVFILEGREYEAARANETDYKREGAGPSKNNYGA